MIPTLHMIKTQREAATTVGKVLAGASLTVELQSCWRTNPELSGQQRGAIQDLSYGVMRFYGQLDALLQLLLNKPLQDKHLRCLLLVCLCQLQYSRTPPYVVVDNAVSTALAMGSGKGAQGLVNAVLRNFMRQQDELLVKATKNDVGHYSHPQWWIDKLHKQYPENYQAVLDVGNQRPPMTLRVNQRKVSVEEYGKLLVDAEMDSVLLWNNAIKLKQPVAVEKLPGFAEGLVSVQDAGAQLAATFLDVHDGMRVLDACAAPGGKTTHLLELADIILTVLDNDAERLARIEQNLERLKGKVNQLICGDAANPSQWWDGKLYDRILADVPCSASGVVRRHPDIKWLRREGDLFKFASIQDKILDALWQTLNKDGKLLYVTCSVFAEENRQQIDKFLNQHSDACQLLLTQAGMIDGQLLPDSQHDGFFYTLLQKV